MTGRLLFGLMGVTKGCTVNLAGILVRNNWRLRGFIKGHLPPRKKDEDRWASGAARGQGKGEESSDVAVQRKRLLSQDYSARAPVQRDSVGARLKGCSMAGKSDAPRRGARGARKSQVNGGRMAVEDT